MSADTWPGLPVSEGSSPFSDPRRSNADVWGFLAFSHGWTWLFWGIVIAMDVDVWSSGWALAGFAVGGLGLPLGGTVMTWIVSGRSGLRALGRRLVDPGRIGWRWWIVVLALVPAIKLASGGLAWATGAVSSPFHLDEAIRLGSQPGELLFHLGFLLLLGPLPEEIGWRGYFLDRLQIRFGTLGASLLLGAAWFAWHGPLFVLPGYYARAGGAPDPVQFGVMILLASVLYTWIHNHTERSILAAILFHFSGNASGELLNAPASVYAYETYLTAVVVLLVIWGWERQRPASEDSPS